MWYSTVNVMIENKDVRYSDNILYFADALALILCKVTLHV